MALSQSGFVSEAITSIEIGLVLSPTFMLATGYLAALYVRFDDKNYAEELMSEVAARKLNQYVSPSCFAIYYAACGEADAMFECLRAAQEEREPFLTRMDAEPYFWPYRSDPRYDELLRSMKLRPAYSAQGIPEQRA